jgi:SAM-dependent methyltransferase
LFARTTETQWDFRVPVGSRVWYRDMYSPRASDVVTQVPVQIEGACPLRRNSFSAQAPWHLTKDQISYIPEARPGAIALDHGCGSGPHRALLEELGYAYHGIDIAGAGADDLVDAHALPYKGHAFDLALSVGVFGQLEQPALAFHELSRVLKPGAYFVGTVPFLEPFNGNGCFNFTHFGLWSALERAGFIVEAILCIRRWNVIRAQFHMGFDWRLPERAADWISRPFMWMLEFYGVTGRLFARNRRGYDRNLLHARHAGAFFFAAKKRSEEPVPPSDSFVRGRDSVG